MLSGMGMSKRCRYGRVCYEVKCNCVAVSCIPCVCIVIEFSMAVIADGAM